MSKVIVRKYSPEVQLRHLQEHITHLKHVDDTEYIDINLGEFRQLYCAVVFFDLCNFTNISRDLSPEQLMHILQDLFKLASKVVVMCGGQIDKYPGDGIVAFFPRKLDDKAHQSSVVENALLCTSLVMSWFYRPNRPKPPLPKSCSELNLCAGIDAGTVSVAHVGSDHHSELILLGNEVNCASKCQQAAAAEEVVVGYDAKKGSCLASDYFTEGPDIDVYYTNPRRPYPAYRFNWLAYWSDRLLGRDPK